MKKLVLVAVMVSLLASVVSANLLVNAGMEIEDPITGNWWDAEGWSYGPRWTNGRFEAAVGYKARDDWTHHFGSAGGNVWQAAQEPISPTDPNLQPIAIQADTIYGLDAWVYSGNWGPNPPTGGGMKLIGNGVPGPIDTFISGDPGTVDGIVGEDLAILEFPTLPTEQWTHVFLSVDIGGLDAATQAAVIGTPLYVYAEMLPNGVGGDGLNVDDLNLQILCVGITETGGDSTVFEAGVGGPASDTYSVRLSCEPQADVDIVVDPTGANAADIDLGLGAGNSITLTFTTSDWQTPQTVTVTAFDDAVNEGNNPPEVATINYSTSSSDPNFQDATVFSTLVTVFDNDSASMIFGDGDTIEVDEAGPTSDTYTVFLTAQPSESVTVAVSPDAQVTVDTTELTFSTSDFNTPQTVTVTAVEDTNVEDDPHPGVITHTATSGDGGYNGLVLQVTASVVENDCGAWGFQLGDIDRDCDVDMHDFSLLGLGWVTCTIPHGAGCIDLR